MFGYKTSMAVNKLPFQAANKSLVEKPAGKSCRYP
jgi:hypothetical protein